MFLYKIYCNQSILLSLEKLESITYLKFSLVLAVCSPTCSNGGTCSSPGTCTCSASWSGSRCTTRTLNSESYICFFWVIVVWICIVLHFDLVHCWFYLAVCSPSCSNGGTCSNPNTCTCPSTYTGSICQTRESSFGFFCTENNVFQLLNRFFMKATWL
jgi:hypothetical protein